MKITDLEKVDRVVIVSDFGGRVYDVGSLYGNGVELHLQDNGRTLKIFPRQEDND